MATTSHAPRRRSQRDGATALRALAKITPRGLAGVAARLRVSRQTVSAWANRRSTPSLEHIRRMARRLGVSARLWTERGANGGR